jgi:hypothetical protein
VNKCKSPEFNERVVLFHSGFFHREVKNQLGGYHNNPMYTPEKKSPAESLVITKELNELFRLFKE